MIFEVSGTIGPESVPHVARIVSRVRRASCGECGSRRVEFDEVVHNGHWLLGECLGCSHRWTRELEHRVAAAPVTPRPARVARRARVGVEVAAAQSEAADAA